MGLGGQASIQENDKAQMGLHYEDGFINNLENLKIYIYIIKFSNFLKLYDNLDGDNYGLNEYSQTSQMGNIKHCNL